jgi:hypothetical protein
MKITTYESYREARYLTQKTYPQHYTVAQVEENLARVDKNRAEREEKLPFVQVVEGAWPEYDVATRWCWQRFGPKDGPCGEYCSEYPACPQVLATKYLEEKPAYMSDEDWEDEWHDGYRNPGDHSHEGSWTTLHFSKTGYDYGVGEYRFANEADRDAFAIVVEGLGFGERYKD